MDNNDFFGAEQNGGQNNDSAGNNAGSGQNPFPDFAPHQPQYSGYAPQPQQQQSAPIKKKDTATRVLYIVLAVFAAAFMFFMGFLTKTLAEPKEVSAFKWALDQIDRYYIGDEVQGKSYTREDYIQNGFSLLDPYSRFLTPAEMQAAMDSMKGEEDGVGVAYKYAEVNGETVIVIADVTFGSPAEGKLFAGDIIYKLNGTLVDPEDPEGTLLGVLTGKVETFVVKRPTFNQATNETEYHEVTAAVEYKKYTASYLKYIDRFSENAPANLPADTAYILFRQFNEPADKELDAAMGLFKNHGMKNLILDLRDNPGGYLTVAQHFAGYLTPATNGKPSVLMTTEFKDDSSTTDYADAAKYEEMNFGKIVVLINGGSASASEVLLGAMLDYGTASYVIGTDSYGKGIMQSTLTHRSSGYGLTITVAKWFTPNGNWIQEKRADGGKGIQPDLKAESNKNNFPYSYERDTEFNLAVDYLKAA